MSDAADEQRAVGHNMRASAGYGIGSAVVGAALRALVAAKGSTAA